MHNDTSTQCRAAKSSQKATPTARTHATSLKFLQAGVPCAPIHAGRQAQRVQHIWQHPPTARDTPSIPDLISLGPAPALDLCHAANSSKPWVGQYLRSVEGGVQPTTRRCKVTGCHLAWACAKLALHFRYPAAASAPTHMYQQGVT